MLFYLLAFLLCGVVGVTIEGRSYAPSQGTLLGTEILCVWGMGVWYRVVDKKSRRILLFIFVFLLMYSLLQLVKYNHSLSGIAAGRYIWYGYYIPMTVLPLLVFRLALRVTEGEKRRSPLWGLLWTVCGLLIGLVFTNDLHRLAFRFPSGLAAAEENYIHGPVYYICGLWMALLLTGALVLLLRKCRLELPGKAVLIPLAAPVLGLVYAVCYVAWGPIRRLWTVGVAFDFAIIGFLEGCIQIGLIPTNNDYEGLFSIAELSAEIVNEADEPVYRAAGARHLTAAERSLVKDGPVLLDDDTRLSARAVSGGRCYWTDDLSRINSLNERLGELLNRIQIRNELLKTENQVLAQRERAEAQNRLYDRIAEQVRQQTVAILALLDETETTDEQHFRAGIARVCVLCAYIKRRSNMELLRSKSERMALEELYLALSESASGLRCCGMEVWVQNAAEGYAPAEQAVLAYEFFETVAEMTVNECKSMVLNLRREENGFSLRIMLRSRALIGKEQLETEILRAAGGQVCCDRDGEDHILSLRFAERAAV